MWAAYNASEFTNVSGVSVPLAFSFTAYEALKEVSPSLDVVLTQLIGGIQSGMGYLGAANLAQLRNKARFIRVSPAGMREAAPHDVVEVKTGS